MNTSTRVEFGLYDVTARSDSAPVTEDAKDFCNLSKDLLLESVPNQNKYGTLETRQWLMDGSFLFFPETPRQYFWGFWSTEQSNGNGAFANPPVLNIRFDKNHSSSGLTLHFYSPTDDWASKVKIQWYDANDGLLAVTMFTPDAVDYYCAHKVENYRRIQLMFLETNKPGRYLKLAGIDYGVYLHFSGEEIIKAHVLEECDPLSAEVSINTLNLTLFNQEGRFSILNPEGYFDVLQHRQKLTVWEDVRRSAHDTSTTSYCMGTFYLDDWSNEDDTLADFTAIDTIGLLDGSPFDGGVYDTHVASLAAEILSGYPYTLDSVLGEERIQGYIPAGTRREALQQLAFAIGAVVDCSRGEIIRIVPAPQRASGLIGTDRRLQDGSKVTLLALVTAVSVTAHRYIPGEASEELYKDTLEPGTYRVTFDAPAVADSLAVRGAELAGRWAIFTFDGQQLNFNGGGGLSSGKLARATAKASQVLDGVPFYAGSKTLQKGTMRNNGSWPDADKLTLENGKLYMYKANGYTEGGLEAVASLLGDASASDIMQGTAASSSKGLHVAGSIVDRGNWSAQIVPGGKVTIPPGRHAGDGSVSAAALKTMALRVSDWPHEYPGMEWHYTLTGGTLVGVAGLGRASGDASSNVIESIRIAGNTIYVKNASGGYPMRDITLLYY